MDILTILDAAIAQGATDIHIVDGLVPTFRIKKILRRQEQMPICTPDSISAMVNTLVNNEQSKIEILKAEKKLDLGYRYNGHKFRINIAISKSVYTLSIRSIPNTEIDLDKFNVRNIVNEMKEFSNGIILVTGKVNSGKSTTLNAYIQEVNKEKNKKIITLEDPIEYEHTSKKSIIVQKEVGPHSDIPTFYDGLINVLREDSDIVVVGEIRDRKTMDVAFDLAESGQLVIGTLHTKSCAETVDRIISLYTPQEQFSVKFILSSTLKMVSSQKLLPSTNDGEVALIPEVMLVDNVIAALIRKDKFVISDIEDAIHTGQDRGCLSVETSFAKMYNQGKISLNTIKESVDKDKFEKIKQIIVRTSDGML